MPCTVGSDMVILPRLILADCKKAAAKSKPGKSEDNSGGTGKVAGAKPKAKSKAKGKK